MREADAVQENTESKAHATGLGLLRARPTNPGQGSVNSFLPQPPREVQVLLKCQPRGPDRCSHPEPALRYFHLQTMKLRLRGKFEHAALCSPSLGTGPPGEVCWHRIAKGRREARGNFRTPGGRQEALGGRTTQVVVVRKTTKRRSQPHGGGLPPGDVSKLSKQEGRANKRLESLLDQAEPFARTLALQAGASTAHGFAA